MDEAEEIDRILDENHSIPERWSEERAPFLGVPFAIKESMRFNGFHNATGILARKDFICEDTALAVEHMIQAGAILLCNTNVSEGCMWFETSVDNEESDLSEISLVFLDEIFSTEQRTIRMI